MSSRSSRKRDASSVVSSTHRDHDDDPLDSDSPSLPPTKKRASRSTASEKAAKKAARMERNRIAAQASRDRKKNHTDYLEGRIADLEAQLAVTTSTPASSVSTSTALTLFPSPPSQQLSVPPVSVMDSELLRLKEENASLRTQLELEKLESRGLQIRLSSLEGKFSRLEALLTQLSTIEGGAPRGRLIQQPETRIVEFDNASTKRSVDNRGGKDDRSNLEQGIEKDNVCSLARRATLQRTMSQRSRIQLLSCLLSSPPRPLHHTLAHNFSTLSPISAVLPPSPRRPSTSPSATTTATRPTLHQILSSIKILPPLQTSRSRPSMHPSSMIRSSVKLGKIGLLPSISSQFNHRNHKRTRRKQHSTCLSSSARSKKERTAVLRLYVSRRD